MKLLLARDLPRPTLARETLAIASEYQLAVSDILTAPRMGGYGSRPTGYLKNGAVLMDAEVPDLYTDGVQIGLGPFGVVLAFAMQPPGQTGTMAPIKVCNLRMSLEHAKVMAIMLKKHLKNFEEQMGEDIPLHPQLTQQLHLSKTEDW